MHNAAYIQMQFEAALLLTGFFSLISWMHGDKLTNRKLLFRFAISFAGLLLINSLSSIVPSYILLIGCFTPLLLRTLRKLQTRFSSSNRCLPENRLKPVQVQEFK